MIKSLLSRICFAFSLVLILENHAVFSAEEAPSSPRLHPNATHDFRVTLSEMSPPILTRQYAMGRHMLNIAREDLILDISAKLYLFARLLLGNYHTDKELREQFSSFLINATKFRDQRVETILSSNG